MKDTSNKKQAIIYTLVGVYFLFLATFSHATSPSLSDGYMTVDLETGMIKDYKAPSQDKVDFIIPAMLADTPTISIGENAFRRKNLISVTIPESVRYIGTGAFADNQLTSITIPDSVVKIGSNAFSGNPLTNVSIPHSLVDIGSDAFGDTSTVTRRE